MAAGRLWESSARVCAEFRRQGAAGRNQGRAPVCQPCQCSYVSDAEGADAGRDGDEVVQTVLCGLFADVRQKEHPRENIAKPVADHRMCQFCCRDAVL